MEKKEKEEETKEAYEQIEKIQDSLSHIARIVDSYEKNVVKAYEKRLYSATTKLDLVNNKLLEKELTVSNLKSECKDLKRRTAEAENKFLAEQQRNEKINQELKKNQTINSEQNQQILLLTKTIERLEKEIWSMVKSSKEKEQEIRFSYEKKIKDLVKDYSEKDVALSAKVELLLKELDKYKKVLFEEKVLKKDLLRLIQSELDEKKQ